MPLRPDHPGLLNRLAKRVTPMGARLLSHGPIARLLPLLETYLAILQGKGAGSGWDLQAEIDIAASVIKRPNAVVFDIGANIGEWSTGLLDVIDPLPIQLFLFEPAPMCVKILRSLDLPQKTQIIDRAISEQTGEALLYIPDQTSPLSSLHMRRDSYHQQYSFVEQSVQTTTIDAMVQAYQIEQIDFIKLDIEGHEFAALRGAYRTLQSGQIKAIAFEFGSGNINSRTYFHDFWDLLHPLGYKFQRVCPGGCLLPIGEYYEDLEYFRGVTNYLALLT